MTPSARPVHPLLLPNLGAEEGDDCSAIRRLASARVCARLWSLLFSGDAVLRLPRTESSFDDRPVSQHWPEALGPIPTAPAFDWLGGAPDTHCWFPTKEVASAFGLPPNSPLQGPPESVVTRVHDKAFALEQARAAGLLPQELGPLLSAFSPSDLTSADDFITAVEERVAAWPEWTGRAFTLKPRLGTSGRGRVPGRWPIDQARLRGALPRLAQRGGAILEPWLERSADLSVSFFISKASPTQPGSEAVPAIRLLSSFEMNTTQRGGYSGHCGEIDSRGRLFSGHPQDESMRAEAAEIALAAREAGFFGPCGVDAFVYRGPAGDRLRSVVEFNARPTMGIVVQGIIRRAWASLRPDLGLEPGNRRAFLFALLPPDSQQVTEHITRNAELIIPPLRLQEVEETGGPQVVLFFGRDLDALRSAYREALNA